MSMFKEGDRVVVSNYPTGDYDQVIGVSGTVEADGVPFVSVRLDEHVQSFGDVALFFPEELRREYRAPKPWMNERNCAGLRPPKEPTTGSEVSLRAEAEQARAEAIMATGPVKMCRRIIELEDRLADSIELEPLREALQGVWPK